VTGVSPSFPRTRESSLSLCNLFWIPAFAGMTDKRLLVLLRPYVICMKVHSYYMFHPLLPAHLIISFARGSRVLELDKPQILLCQSHVFAGGGKEPAVNLTP
jgi:hypothetical protein